MHKCVLNFHNPFHWDCFVVEPYLFGFEAALYVPVCVCLCLLSLLFSIANDLKSIRSTFHRKPLFFPIWTHKLFICNPSLCLLFPIFYEFFLHLFITSYWERDRESWTEKGKERERILFILCWINFLYPKFVVCIHWIWYLAAWHNSMFCCLSLEKFEYAQQIESTHSDKKIMT